MLDSRRAQAWYRIQSTLAVTTGTALGNLWAEKVDPDRIAASWAAQIPTATDIVVAQSVTAASGAGLYVAASVGSPEPVKVNALRLVDRERIASQLFSGAIRSIGRINRGIPIDEAMNSGKGLTQLIGAQATRDTARDAVGIAQVADTRTAGWVRYLQTPSCGRCAILAGRFYTWSDGFKRHPACDCAHRPVGYGEDVMEARASVTDPKQYFNSLSEADQNKLFGPGVSEEIRGGKNISKAVNVDRSGMIRDPRKRSVGDLPRPILDGVMAEVNGDRVKAVQRLKDYGLINDSGQRTKFQAKKDRGRRLETSAPRLLLP